MSGTGDAGAISLIDREQQLVNLLGRNSEIRPLDALASALRFSPTTVPLADIAIGLDANAFLRLGKHGKSADIIDYLASAHQAPLILPGQSIQEFWNNQFSAVDTISTSLKKKIEAVEQELDKVDIGMGEYRAKFDELLQEFNEDHGHIYDATTVSKTLSLIEMLRERAIVPYAPRTKLLPVAAHRKRTKTPPGFKDEGDGDFFIWADFLTGLQTAESDALSFSAVALVTMDKKIDWSRGGIAHPILTAEVEALFGVPFEVWSIEGLASRIAEATTSAVPQQQTEATSA